MEPEAIPLPAIPEPKLYPSGTYPDGVLTYSADQMHDYARAAVLAERERCIAACQCEELAGAGDAADDMAYNSAIAHCIAAIRSGTAPAQEGNDATA